MTPRRQQTSLPGSQPVRFYKFIALTFLFLTIVLLGLIVFMSSKRATIVIETKASPIDISATVKVADSENSGVLSGVVRAAMLEKTDSFEPTGSNQIEGVATGSVTLHNVGTVAQPLIRTTRLLSEDGVLFRIDQGVTVPAGGTIDVEVYADEAGAASDIGPGKFTIPGLREDKQKIIYATSSETMRGGVRNVGALSLEDVSKAEKILLSELEEEVRQELQKEYANHGAAFTVMQHTFENSAEVGDEITEFDLTAKATVVGVFFDKAALRDIALAELRKRAVDDSEVVEGSREDPTVRIKEYDVETGEATLEVLYSGVAYLNAESKQLDKSAFFGKNRDEVRRYVLTLDHVRGVDVKFTPAWMGSVPHIADHVNIVVKNVE